MNTFLKPFMIICNLFVFGSSIFLFISCTYDEEVKKPVYEVKRIDTPLVINAEWDKKPWNEIKPLQIDKYRKGRPDPFPTAEAKIAYDDSAVYVIYRVEDYYVRAIAREFQDSVWRDNCVEFFFTPDSDVETGYFNLEMNCGGTALFRFQKAQFVDMVKIAEEDFKQIKIAHSMPKIVDPEIPGRKDWILEYRIPFSILKKYVVIKRPMPCVIWRVNFYKGAGNNSYPHSLMWSLITGPKGSFHQPKYFGELKFK